MKSHYIQTLKLGFPIAVGQIGVIILGFADTMMVGQYSTNSLAAASFVNSVFNLITFLMLGYAYGLTPIISSFYGQGKYDQAGASLKTGLAANFLYGGGLLLIMSLLYFFVDCMGQPTHLLPLIRPYYIVMLISMFFVLIFNTIRQFTDGITDTPVGMWTLLSGNLINIVGNWVLIYGIGPFPQLGLLGAGLSTLFARIYMAAALALIVAFRRKYGVYRKGFIKETIQWKNILHINSISMPVSLQMGMETFAFTGSAIMAGWLGTVPLAGYQVIITISQLSFLFYYSFASGMSIRIATFKGMHDYKQLKMAAIAGKNLLLIMAVLACVMFYFAGRPLISLFTKDAQVASTAALLIVPLMIYQFGDAMQICYANALRGTGNVLKMMWLAGICYLFIGIPSGYIMGFVFNLGIQGVFSGLPFGLSIAGAAFYILFQQVVKKEA